VEKTKIVLLENLQEALATINVAKMFAVINQDPLKVL
jgi:hypothetical protein